MTSRKKPEVLASAIDSSVGTLSSEQQHVVERGVRGGADIDDVVAEVRADVLVRSIDAVRASISVPAALASLVEQRPYEDGCHPPRESGESRRDRRLSGVGRHRE